MADFGDTISLPLSLFSLLTVLKLFLTADQHCHLSFPFTIVVKRVWEEVTSARTFLCGRTMCCGYTITGLYCSPEWNTVSHSLDSCGTSVSAGLLLSEKQKWMSKLQPLTLDNILAGILLGPLGFNDLVNYHWSVPVLLLDGTLNCQTLAAPVGSFSVMSMDLIVGFGEHL